MVTVVRNAQTDVHGFQIWRSTFIDCGCANRDARFRMIDMHGFRTTLQSNRHTRITFASQFLGSIKSGSSTSQLLSSTEA
jgi:hypothetical protein